MTNSENTSNIGNSYNNNHFAVPVKQALQFFSRTCSVFREDDSKYTPTPGQFTVAQHVAHVAQTIDWFIVGGFRPEGFDLDFVAHQQGVRECESLKDAMIWLVQSVDNAADVLARKTPEEMMAPIAAGPVMGGEPRAAIIAAIAEHTSHHRGSLAVYGRMLGYTPPMPYGE